MNGFTRFLRGLGSLVALGALVAGIPVGLAVFVGWPLPSSMPNVQTIGDFLTANGVSDNVLIDGLAIALWLLWLAFVSAVVAESVAAVRGGVSRRVVGGPLQMVAASLVGFIVLSIPNGVKPTGGVRAPLASVVQPARSMQLAVATTASVSVTETPAATRTVSPEYVVVRHDTLWGIAERFLGNPQRWREIFQLNQGVAQPDGRSLVDGDRIYPGWRLTLPSDAKVDKSGVPAAEVIAAPTIATPDIAEPGPARTEVAPRSDDKANPVDVGHVSVAPPAAAVSEEQGARDASVSFGEGVVVGSSLSVAIGSALAIVRRRRQRRYVPGEAPVGMVVPDVAHLRGVEALLGVEGLGDANEPGIVDTRRGDNSERIDLSRVGVTRVDGSDALGHARHLLLEFVASHDADQAQTYVVGAGLAKSLGISEAFSGVDIVDDVHRAKEVLLVEVLKRRRLFDEMDVNDIEALRVALDGEPLPATLVVVSPADLDVFTGAWNSSLVGVGIMVVDRDDAGSTSTVDEVNVLRIRESDATAAFKVVSEARQVDDSDVIYAAIETEQLVVADVAEPQRERRMVRLTHLGSEHIAFNGKEATTGLRSSGRELLAFLVARPNGVTKEQVIEALWPGKATSAANGNFRAAVTNVRQILRKLTGFEHEQFIVLGNERYRLDAELFESDVWHFEQVVQTLSRSVVGDVDAMRRAVDAYTGDFLAGEGDLWAEEVRQGFRRQVLDIYVRLADAAYADGDVDGASEYLQRAISIEPVAEELYLRLMRIYAEKAARYEVERTMKRLEEALDELGLDPRIETKAEYRRLMAA